MLVSLYDVAKANPAIYFLNLRKTSSFW